MKKKVLLFNIASTEDRQKIIKALLPLHIDVASVAKEDYLQSLGFLAGSRGLPKTDAVYDGDELDGQMLLLCGIYGTAMDRALTALKKQGVKRDCIKAVVTATNSAWNVLQLYKELKKEHDYMNKPS
ncbi:MAG: DUF3783 domain-containing protein [Oscillospiraceae bacterium]